MGDGSTGRALMTVFPSTDATIPDDAAPRVADSNHAQGA